ncbi:MAG: hypothetical protein R3C11_28110 [Planctomycetaceae bacterium]
MKRPLSIFLLLVVALSLLVGGIIHYFSDNPRQDLLDELRAASVIVHTRPAELQNPSTWIRSLNEYNESNGLQSVWVYSTDRISEDKIQNVLELLEIELLLIDNPHLSASAFHDIDRSSNLRMFALLQTSIDKEGLEALTRLPVLASLTLRDVNLSTDSFEG